MERELLFLGLLRRQEMHGYQLHEFIDRYMQTCVDLKKSTAYFLLDKLASKGWVTRSLVREGNRPPRQVYRLTRAGEEQFQALLRENLSSYLPARFGGDVGLTFLDQLPADEARTLLGRRKRRLADALANVSETPPHTGSLQLVVEHQKIHLESELVWLDTIIKRLQQSEESEKTSFT